MAALASTKNSTIGVRGFERTTIWYDNECFKIAHTMLLKGPATAIHQLTTHLPHALQLTFNRHPRMRGRLAKDAFATLEIHPHLTLQDITSQGLLTVTDFNKDGINSDDKNKTNNTNQHEDLVSPVNDLQTWQRFIQQQSAIPFDRVNRFTFELHAWVDAANGAVRLFLFSDHYNSDGASGNTILNDVLGFAAALSRSPSSLSAATSKGAATDLAETKDEGSHAINQVDVDGFQEAAVEPSLYDIMLGSRTILHPVVRGLVNTIMKPALQRMPAFNSLLPVHKANCGLTMPPPMNPAMMLFATGSQQSLKSLMQRCRQHETSFIGALTAAIITGYAAVSEASLDTQLPIKINSASNMRERAANPVPAHTVGQYASVTPLTDVCNTLDIPRRKFWELARDTTKEARSVASGFFLNVMALVSADKYYHSRMDPAFWDGIPSPLPSISDVTISSVGKYPHPMTHSFAQGDLRVSSLHYTCSTPFLLTMCLFYVTSVVDAQGGVGIGYSINHGYEDEVGQRLLDTVVAIMEQHDKLVDDHATLADVVSAVQHQKDE